MPSLRQQAINPGIISSVAKDDLLCVHPYLSNKNLNTLVEREAQ